MTDYIYEIVRNKEEELLRSLLSELLDRQPEIEDARRLTKGLINGMRGYRLAFDGAYIGDVLYHFPDFENEPHEFKIEFITHLLKH